MVGASHATWARAFASQALADLTTRDLLASQSAPKCHRLHFLQMSAEKLCKAFLIQANGFDSLAYKHCLVAKTLPLVLRRVLESSKQNSHQIQTQLRSIRHLSREIELLSPSCDSNGGRPDNVEYPWTDELGEVHFPADHPFSNLPDEGRDMLRLTKLMRTAAELFLA